MTKELKLNDSMRPRDVILNMDTTQHKGFRTEVLVQNELGETIFENSLMLGGGIYVLEKLFGVTSSLEIADLNDIMNIATTGTPITEKHPKDHVVCLFGVGIGGAGDSITSVKDLNVKDREITGMVPFRVTAEELNPSEKEKYWFRKKLESGETAYYLKSFESTPQIKPLWKDGEGDEDGSYIQEGVHTSQRPEDVEVFVEMILKIDKTDIREWFELNGEIEKTRINTIGLFAGIKSDISALGDGSELDYKNVKLFSKLNIHNEMLVGSKELTIRYRIFSI